MAQNDIVYSFSGPVQVYRMSVFLKIVLAVVALIVIVLFSFFLLEQYLPVSSTDKMNTFNQIFCLISVSLGFALLFAVFKYKIEVYPDKMKKVSLLGNTELPINKIQGFRTISNRGSETFVMYPKDSGVKKISIGEMMERKEDLKKWIRQSLTDLDAADYQEEMNNVLHDKVLGDTEEQRLLLLQRAKKATMFLNGIAIALSVWCMLYPRPYEILVTSLIMLPLISLGFLHYFRGTIKFYVQRQKSVYPRIATAFLFPLFVLTIKVAMGYNILNWDGFWFPFSCLSIVFYLLTLYVAKDIRHKISWVLALVIMCSIYSYAAIISLNSVLDNSAPYVYKAQLIQKRVSSGRSTTYYFTLSPWALKKEESEIRVRKGVFDRHQNNEDVEVITRFGRFGIPWFFVQ